MGKEARRLSKEIPEEQKLWAFELSSNTQLGDNLRGGLVELDPPETAFYMEGWVRQTPDETATSMRSCQVDLQTSN
jgi:hypothetical protein